MILPTKHIAEDRALLTVGATALRCLTRPMTVSTLWEEMSRLATGEKVHPPVRYDEFVLALDLLFLLAIIELQDGLMHRVTP